MFSSLSLSLSPLWFCKSGFTLSNYIWSVSTCQLSWNAGHQSGELKKDQRRWTLDQIDWIVSCSCLKVTLASRSLFRWEREKRERERERDKLKHNHSSSHFILLQLIRAHGDWSSRIITLSLSCSLGHEGSTSVGGEVNFLFFLFLSLGLFFLFQFATHPWPGN